MAIDVFKLRNEANIERYIDHDDQACTNTIMQLYENMPDLGSTFKLLYRYRQLNEYEIEALENETIYMRWPSSFSDQEDCKPVIDLKEISRFIINKKHPVLNADVVYKQLNIEKAIKSNIRFQNKIIQMRNMWMIACFTERHDNTRMWNEYADMGKGICLVYDFMDVLQEVFKRGGEMTLMPVRYVDNRDSYLDIQLNHADLIEDLDSTDAKYRLTVMTKEKEKYSFEEEWRLVFENEKEAKDGINKGKSISFINPKCVILGKSVDTTADIFKKFEEAADKKKNIPITTL